MRCVFPLLMLAGMLGCSTADNGGYAPTAIYPPRVDPLVLSTGDLVPTRIHELGKLDESIAELETRGAKLKWPRDLTKEQQGAITEVLTDLFGTPAEPRIKGGNWDSPSMNEILAAGAVVYSQGQRCSSCHGMSGDGRGPTSLWRYPPARDFRQGMFKFVSHPSGWPNVSDVRVAIHSGIDGNSMPPFAMLTGAQLNTVTHYVLHLMLRGRMEYEMIRECDSETPPSEIHADAAVRWPRLFQAARIAWCGGGESGKDATYIPLADNIRRGHALFVSEQAGCMKCHVDYGRQAPLRYDVWGVAVRPSDLTKGRYLGGQSAQYLAHRIRIGIPGSNMPASSIDAPDLVIFLQALPDPLHLPADVRRVIYPEAK